MNETRQPDFDFSGRTDPLFQTLIKTAVDGIVVIDEFGMVQVYNDACERLFQYPAKEVVGRNVQMLMPSPYRDEHDEYLSRFRETGERRIIGIGREVLGRRKDGLTFPMYLSVGEGTLHGRRIFVGIIHDLTQIKTETAMFQTLIATAVDGIMVIDELGIVQTYNEACERLFQYRTKEVIGHNVSMLMPAPYREEHDRYIDRYKKTGDRRIIGIGREVLGRRKDGTTFPMYLSVGEGNVSGTRVFVGIIHDLTQIKAEAARREGGERHLAAIVESSGDAIFSKALDGLITSWNNAAERIFGYTANEAIGRPLDIIIPAGRFTEEDVIMAQIKANRRIENYETIRKRKDGTEIAVSLSVSPIHDAHGDIVGAAKIVRDVSQAKAAEAHLRDLQAELLHVTRLTSMGQLSSALAHELNQPLTAITNYLNAARRTLQAAAPEEHARLGEILEKATGQTLRAGQIIRRLRDFVEKRDSNRWLEDPNAVISDSIALGLVGAADGNVKLFTDLAPDLPQVMVDRVQIQQVLINLMRNAVEAMQESGKRELHVSTKLGQGDFVEVAVADTGSGMPAEVAERLFQPFVTTKAKGMGVGLTICRSIVEAHGGKLWMTPREGGGTVFYFSMPTMKAVELENGV
jgi:two-component system sensor kinase FixL